MEIEILIEISLYRWEFRLTLKINAKMLREVVNRVKLGDQHTRRRSRGEVLEIEPGVFLRDIVAFVTSRIKMTDDGLHII